MTLSAFPNSKLLKDRPTINVETIDGNTHNIILPTNATVDDVERWLRNSTVKMESWRLLADGTKLDGGLSRDMLINKELYAVNSPLLLPSFPYPKRKKLLLAALNEYLRGHLCDDLDCPLFKVQSHIEMDERQMEKTESSSEATNETSINDESARDP